MARYVGKRIVPKHCGYWDNAKEYEMESVVYDRASGNSYISRKTVPVGTDISQTEYWALCSDFNMQMDLLEQHITQSEAAIKADNDATEAAIRQDNDATESAIRQDNAATRQHVDESLEETTTDLTQRVTAAQTAMTQQKASFDATAQQLNARMDEVLAAGTGDGSTEIADARVDADGNAYDSLGTHIRDILPRAKIEAGDLFLQKMAETYDAGIFRLHEYKLHEGKFIYAYTDSSFSGWISQFEAPADINVTCLRFYVTARERAITKLRITVAIGEKTDAAIRFQEYLDVNIEPAQEEYVTCLIPHIKLQEGETIYVGIDGNTPCSIGFGYAENDGVVSWYATSGNFPSLEDYSRGSHKKIYVEMAGVQEGVFTTEYLLGVAENHEDRIHEVEQWKMLVDQFQKEDIYINKQNPLPVTDVVERYNYSTFIGWACPIGHPTDFDTLIFSVKNRSTEDYVENVRCFITLGNREGDVLMDEVMSNVHIAPGEWRKIEFHFSKLIENTEEAELYAGFSCDQQVSFMGGSCGTILRPPTYGVVAYNSTDSPSYAAMMKKVTSWMALYDPEQDNTSKVDFLIAKKSEHYGLGEFEEPVRAIAADEAQAKIEEAMSEKATFELPPRVVLPDVFHAVVGDTLQLFYRGIVEHPNPYNYNIEFRCDIGKNTPRYFEVTPVADNVGDHTLTVRVRDHLDSILATGTTVLRIHAVGETPSLRKNILCVGDSLTGSGTWCKEALRRLTETGGTPAGLGLSNIRFIGTKKNGECGYEGYGGWTWGSYLSAPTATKLGMWVYGSHDKDSTDQHSLWEDGSGNIWSMETIETGRIKFTRYQDHTAPMPIGAGTLHHYQNATHTADIAYDETVYAEGNPFWDSDEGQVNFRTYCERNGFDRVDYMVTLLSWNGMAASHYASSESLIATHVTNAKRLIRILHEQYSNAKVKMMGIQLPSVNGGCGHSYGANSQYSNWYGLVRSVMNMNLAYQEMANEDEFKDYVEFINISGQFDSEYNMPRQSKTVNTRSTSTELVGTNGVHPSTEGYYQIGDAAYRALVPELTEV